MKKPYTYIGEASGLHHYTIIDNGPAHGATFVVKDQADADWRYQQIIAKFGGKNERD